MIIYNVSMSIALYKREIKMKKGFTLAETLITLGVIGVIATLTLPNLIADFQNKTYVAQLQRSYNMLQSAVDNLFVDKDVDNLADSGVLDSAGNLESFLKNYFKIVKYCSNPDDCIPATYKAGLTTAATRARDVIHGKGTQCIKVNTGATYCMFVSGSSLGVDLDVNGTKGPNAYGRDAHRIFINQTGIISSSDTCGSDYAQGCFSRIMDAGWVMDY